MSSGESSRLTSGAGHGAVRVPKVQLAGALGDQQRGGRVMGVGYGVLQEQGHAGVVALSAATLLALPAAAGGLLHVLEEGRIGNVKQKSTSEKQIISSLV